MSESLEQSGLHEGYKEVQFGPKTLVVPSDWSTERFGNVFDRRRESIDDIENETVKYVGLKHLNSGQLTINGYDEDGRKRSSSRVFREGDVLFGKLRPNLNKAAIAPFSGVCSSDIIPIYAEKDARQQYLPYLMHSKLIRDRVVSTMEGTNLPRTSWGDLEKTLIPLPSLSEQLRIAGILSTVDEQIQQTDEIIKENKALRDGLLQDLFGCLSPNSGQKEVQLGPFQVQIPDHWVISDLDNLNQDDYPICYGVVQPGDHDEDGIPLLNIEDVDENGNIHRESIHKISLDLHEEYSRSQLQGGEVLVSVKGTVGSIVQLNEEIGEANISRDLARVTPTTDLDARWLKYCLSTKIYQDLIDVFSTGSTRASLNIGELREIPILCPPVPEQERISEVLSTVEREIEIERENKQYLQDLKRGLMQDLLTGKVRITSD